MKIGPLTVLGSIKGDTWERIYDYTVVAGEGVVGSSYPLQNGTYVKATSTYAGDYPYVATDPTISLIGIQNNKGWLTGSPTNQRFHIDLGIAKIINKVYYENNHHSGTETSYGAKNFTLWGSNNAAAFAELTYGTDTNWTQLTCDVSQFAQHAAADAPDPKYVNVTNATAYRYYAFKIADNWAGSGYLGFRRVELQGPQVTSLTISGLNGDVDEEYILESKVVNGYNGIASAFFRPNNDVGTNYGYQYVDGNNTSAAAGRATNDQVCYIGYNTSLNNISQASCKLFSKSGFVRTVISDFCRDVVGTTVGYSRLWANVWNNTATNITSLVIAASQTGGIGVGSSFQLYRKTRRS